MAARRAGADVAADPLSRLQVVVGYAVTGVWSVTCIGLLAVPHRDTSLLLLVNAIMGAVVGGLYASRLLRRNGVS